MEELDQASVSVECISSFRLLWGVGVHNPIPPFPEDLCVVRNLLRGGSLFWGYFSPERVSAAVDTHRSCFSSSIDDDMGVYLLACCLCHWAEQWSKAARR
ncbi:hypothetical protein HID58_094789 [Brassica napus]|uniref:Uncharacterized protein n=1 Tax=Brassica napus TaxID=3708 RepID=A0ABQ7X8L2_BRANA|nr:hypothetical protein HID58_094789 [Brassica napus]